MGPMSNGKLFCMRKYIRNYVKGGTYFFTMVTKNRTPFFKDPVLCELFLAGVEKNKTYHPFELVTFCILPDHIHLLISLPEGVKNFSNLLREIKKTVTKSIREYLEQSDLIVWQARFWEHTIRSQRDMQTHYDYIHYNPVKHGYVDSVDQWQWSSIKDKSDKKEIEASLKHIEGLNKKGYFFGE